MALILHVTRANGTFGDIELAPGSNFTLGTGEAVSVQSVSELLSIDLRGTDVVLTFDGGEVVLHNLPVAQIQVLADQLGAFETGSLGDGKAVPDAQLILGDILGWASPDTGTSPFSAFSGSIDTGLGQDDGETGGPTTTRTITADTLTATSAFPAEDHEGNTGAPDPVIIDLFADLVTAEDTNALNTPGFLTGSISVALASGSAPSDTGLITIDQTLGTISYDRADFDSLKAGERAVFDISFEVASGGNAATQTVQLVINGLNDAPVLTGTHSASIEEGGDHVLTVSELGFADVDDGASEVRFTVFGQVNGIVLVGGAAATSFTGAELAAGEVSFHQDGSKSSAASFLVSVEDGNEDGSTPVAETFTFAVTPVNDAPVAAADSYEVDEDTRLDVAAAGVLGNDTDAEHDALTAILVSGPAHGRLVLNTDGSFSYAANANYNGADSFTYMANDGNSNSNAVTVTLTVNAVNDAPVAANDAFSGNEDTTISGNVLTDSGVDSDVDGDHLSVTAGTYATSAGGSVTIATNGDFTYSPKADFNGADSFIYTVSDGNGSSDIGTVTLTVVPVNDVPVAVADTGATDQDTVLTVSAANGLVRNDTDPDVGDTLHVSGVNGTPVTDGDTITLASGALLTINADGSYDYDPNGHFDSLAEEATTTDSFTYTVSDGKGGTDTAAVTITITGTNDAPVAEATSGSGIEDATKISIDLSGADVDGSIAFFRIASLPTNGRLFADAALSEVLSVDAQVTASSNVATVWFVPDGDFNGASSFSYAAIDDQGLESSTTANATINVTAVNDAPCGTDETITLSEDTSYSFKASDFGFSDVDAGDTLSGVRIDALPKNGMLTLNGVAVVAGSEIATSAIGELVFTPAGNANGDNYASFTFSVKDSAGAFDTSPNTMTIDVTQANDAPNVLPINAGTVDDEDAPVTIDLLAGQTDADGDKLSATGVKVTDDLGKSVTFIDNHDGTITIDPTQFAAALAFGQSRTLTVNYEVTDGTTPVANTATLVVDGANQDPVLTDLSTSVGFGENIVNEYTVYIDTQVSFTDDSADLDGGALTVSGLASSGEDTVGIANQGTSAGKIGVSGNEVSYSGTLIGTFTGGTGTDPLVVSFNASATPEAVDALIQSLYYSNSSDEPTEDRTLTYTVTDGDGGTVSATVDVHVYPQVEPPIAVNDTVITNAEYAETISVPWEAVLANDIPNGGISSVLPGEFAEDGGGETLDYTVNSYGYFGYFDNNSGGGSNQAYVGVQTVSGATISGTSGNDIIILEENSPATISGGGGADWLYGSYGNDTFLISDTGFAKVDGGGFETDVLKLTGSGEVLDLVSKGDQAVREIDVFDLTGTGDNALVANYQRFASSTSTSYYDKADKADYKLFHITGDAGDQIQLEDSSAWTRKDDVTENGITYRVYTQSDPNGIDHDVKLFIQSEVSDNLNAPPVATDDALSGTATPTALTNDIAASSVQAGVQQDYAAIAPLLGGGFVATWMEKSRSPKIRDVYAQRFDSDGNAVGDKIALPTEYTNVRTQPKVAGLDTGGFVLTWAGYVDTTETYNVYSQKFDASGTADGSQHMVNTFTAKGQLEPGVVDLPGGGYTVIWTSQGQDGDGDGIYARRFDDKGEPVGTSEFLVNSTTQGPQANADIASFDTGGFIVVWDGYGVSSNAIYGRQFDASGVAMGLIEFKINSGTSSSVGHPAVAALDGGGYVVTWVSRGQDGNNYAIYGQRYDASGQAVGSEFEAGAVARNFGSNTDVAALAGGGFIVTWFDTDADGDGLYGQRFDADGTAIGDVFAVNEITTSGQWNFDQPGTTATLADGTFAAVWHTYGTNGDGDIVVRLFNAFHITEDNVFTFNTAAVLANDTDANGDTLTITAITDADGNVSNGITSTEGATLTLNGDGTISYDPTGVAAFDALGDGETLTDSFTYTVSDGKGGTDTATVSITVNGVNDAPVISSPDTATISENTKAVLTVVATDVENQDLTFSISGGDDASLFAIDAATGELSFVNAPNYENPQDAGANNIYDVEVTVTDTQGGTDTQTIAVTVNDVSGANLFAFAARPADSISYAYAELADVDGDKDLDAVVGQADGYIRYFENTGSTDASNFVERTGTDNPFDGLRSKYYSAPSLVDIDDDGDLDLFVGRGNTSGDFAFKFWENTGSKTAPVFERKTGADDPLDGFTFGNSINAAFGDITGDHVLDMVVGASTGKLKFLENTGTATDPVFIERIGTDNPFDGISVVNPGDVGASGYSAPELVDWNKDGLLDLVMGSRSLGFQLYLNTGTSTAPAFTLATSPFGGIAYSYATGALGDLNGDGMPDILVGSSYYLTQYNAEPLKLASAPDEGDPLGTELTPGDLQPIIDQAINLFADVGANAAQLETLSGTSFAIADLGGNLLGLSIGSQITLDDNAAGAGWHVDTNGSDIAGVDLLTVIMHEMGHQLGFADSDTEGLMNHDLAVGERVLPGAILTGTDAGDDLHLSSANITNIDGGLGTDTLTLTGSDITLDFTRLDPAAVTSVEKVDLSGSGDNTLKVALSDVLDMSDDTANGIHTLTVNGNSGDAVQLADSGWSQQADTTVDGTDYHVFTNEMGRLLIENDVTVAAA